MWRSARMPAAYGRDGPAGRALDAVTVLTNNVTVVRKVIAVALSLAVQGAALGAPLVHVHPADHATDHHGARAVHTHWTGHHSHSHRSADMPAIDREDHDRAVYLNTYVAAAGSSFFALGITHSAWELPVPAETGAHGSVQVVHSHDPPFLRLLSSRAPPAFLS